MRPAVLSAVRAEGAADGAEAEAAVDDADGTEGRA